MLSLKHLKNQTYEIVPRIDQQVSLSIYLPTYLSVYKLRVSQVCFTQYGGGDLEQMLPDLTNWTYAGTKDVK